jgi:CBS domain-containing protein
MTAGEYCNREVIVVETSESVRAAVNLMREHHVGDVVVVDREHGQPIPRGILTDRDIVLEILAEDVDLSKLNVGDVMSYELVTVNEDTSLVDGVALMHQKGVRRVPVVDYKGMLVGILTADDILELIAEQLSHLVGLIRREQSRERARRK